MKRYIIQQTIDLNLQWVVDADSEEEALEKAHGNFDNTKVLSLEILDWDRPWDANEIEEGDLTLMSEETFNKWNELGVL